MILGDPKRWDAFAAQGVYGEHTLDALLRAAAATTGEQTALRDVTGDNPRTLRWAELDARVDRLANHLLDIGLKPDDRVIVMAGIDADTLTAILALSRAGMIAMPLAPVLGPRDAAQRAERTGARAIVTQARTGPQATAEIAALAAFSSPGIRFLLGFGTDLPDGVMPLDAVVPASDAAGQRHDGALRGGRAGDHVAVLTFDGAGDTAGIVARNHGQLIAASLPVSACARLDTESVLATAFAPTSLAAIAGIIVPWLTARSCLVTLPAWRASEMMTLARKAGASHLALPGTLAETGPRDGMTLLRVWRAPEQVAAPRVHAVDVMALGEAGIMVARGQAADTIPAGGLRIANDKPAILEPRLRGVVHRAGEAMEPGSLLRGPLAVRGPATPLMAYPGDEAGAARMLEGGCMLTGLRAEIVEADGPAIRVIGDVETRARSGPFAIELGELDVLYAGLGEVRDAAAFEIPHAVLGSVFGMAYCGDAEIDLEAIVAELQTLGCGAHLLPVELYRVDRVPRDAKGGVDRAWLLDGRKAG